MHHLDMHVLPCRRYQSVGSFDGEPGNDGGGVNSLPLEHTVFTIDDTVPWGVDRRHDDQQQGSESTVQHQQRGQPSGETSASENASPGPVGKLQLADFHHDLHLLGSIPVCMWPQVPLQHEVTGVHQRMAVEHDLILALCRATDKLLGVVGADAILHQGLQRVRALNRTGMNSMLSELDERYLQVRTSLGCGLPALLPASSVCDG